MMDKIIAARDAAKRTRRDQRDGRPLLAKYTEAEHAKALDKMLRDLDMPARGKGGGKT